MSTIITVVIFAYLAICAGLFALIARKKTWMGSLMRTVLIIVSAIIACIISSAVSGSFGDQIHTAIVEPMLADLGDILKSVPLLENTISAVASMLLAPIIFLVVFPILRFILSLLGKIPEKLVFEKLVPEKMHLRWLGCIIGAINGFLVAAITIIPICGYLILASDVLTAAQNLSDNTPTETLQLSAEESAEGDDILTTLTTLNENPAVKTVSFVASPVFDALTTADIPTGHGDETVKFVLSKDVGNIFNIVDHVTVFLDDMSSGKVSDNTKDNMHALSSAFTQTEWSRCFASDTFSSMAKGWLKGDSFMGAEMPELPAVFAPTFNKALEVIGSVTPATVEQDLNTIFDVFYYFLQGDLMNMDAANSDIMSSIGESKIISNIISTLEANERFAPLADEIMDMGMRVVASSIGKVELGSDEQYDQLVGEISKSLNDVLDMPKEERDAEVKKSIKAAMENYDSGLQVEEDVALAFADKMIEDLGADNEITDDEISDYLDSYVVVDGDKE